VDVKLVFDFLWFVVSESCTTILTSGAGQDDGTCQLKFNLQKMHFVRDFGQHILQRSQDCKYQSNIADRRIRWLSVEKEPNKCFGAPVSTNQPRPTGLGFLVSTGPKTLIRLLSTDNPYIPHTKEHGK
jgi:hypothetical protein